MSAITPLRRPARSDLHCVADALFVVAALGIAGLVLLALVLVVTVALIGGTATVILTGLALVAAPLATLGPGGLMLLHALRLGHLLGLGPYLLFSALFASHKSATGEVVRTTASIAYTGSLKSAGQLLEAMLVHDERESIHVLREVSTVVLAGDSDKLIMAEHTDLLASELPEAEHQVLTDTGHLLPLERPQPVIEAVQRQIAAISKPTRPRLPRLSPSRFFG